MALIASAEVPPENCQVGGGFGCVLTPRDLVVFSSVIIGVFGVLVVTLFAVLVVAALPVRARHTGVWIILGLLAGALSATLGGIAHSASVHRLPGALPPSRVR